jgi:hypothetical protein
MSRFVQFMKDVLGENGREKEFRRSRGERLVPLSSAERRPGDQRQER